MSNPREVLIAYSQEQASDLQVWRALTEHTAYYVPAGFAVTQFGEKVMERVMIFADEVPREDHDLFLFTDPVAAARAEGAPIGVFTSEFSGVQIFGALSDGFTAVRINPHSPKSEGWYISQEAFPLAKLWAQVVKLEQSLQGAGELPHAAIAAHPGLMVLINSERLPITLNLQQGSYGVAFTSPDRFQRFVAGQPPEQRASLQSATLDGATLCKQLQNFEVAGVALYCRDSGGPVILPREQFAQVIGSA